MIRSGFQIILFLAFRGVRKHAFSSFVAVLTIAMATGLFLSTWRVNQETRKAFNHSTCGFDAVLGARGSKLQIILNSLFHMEASPGNLDWEQYELLKNTPGVEAAFPIAVGDNYLGYRLVGTEPEMLESHQWKKGSKFELRRGGRIFTSMAKEAVVGSFVARKLGLKSGDRFHPYHGLNFKEENRHDDVYLVVGVLEATGTPADRVIWIPIKGIQLMEGHDESMAQSISAVLLKLRGSMGFSLNTKYNKQGTVATLAWPIASTLSRFFDKFSWFQKILELVAVSVAVIGALIIVLTLRSSMNEKKREFAILRCLGASRGEVTGVVLCQSLLLSLMGAVGGVVLHFMINFSSLWIIREKTGVIFEVWAFDPLIAYVVSAVSLIGLLSGILPAVHAYRNDLAENLKPSV